MDATRANTARNRIRFLLDENSFMEIGAGITARATDYNIQKLSAPSDGVVTGYGLVRGRLVYIYSQEPSVFYGTIGEMHARKIGHLYDLAMKMGAPIIGLIDCAGIRVQEGTDALEALGSIYYKQTMASGVILQITAIFGNCGGGMALFPTMTDFTFMESSRAKLMIHANNSLSLEEEEPEERTALFHLRESGLIDFFGDEAFLLERLRALLDILPGNYEENATAEYGYDNLNRLLNNAERLRGATSLLLREIADNHFFYECKSLYAPSMVTGFLRLNKQTIGCIANQTERYDAEGKLVDSIDARLTPDGCRKATDFVQFCNAFQIPVLTLTNVLGFSLEKEEEKRVSREAGKLMNAFSSATIPKVNVILGAAFGTAYILMNSKALGADLVYAWPDSKIGTMDAKQAAKILYEKESEKEIEEKAKEYAKTQTSVEAALKRGIVDEVIWPRDTRRYLISAFEMLYTKRDKRANKRHGLR